MATLETLRERAGLTQVQLAQACSVSESVIYRWEHGQRVPRSENIRKLAAALRVTPQVVLAAVYASQEAYNKERAA